MYNCTIQALTFAPTLTVDKLDLFMCLKFLLRLTVVCRVHSCITCQLNFFIFFLNSCQLAMLILRTAATAPVYKCNYHHKSKQQLHE